MATLESIREAMGKVADSGGHRSRVVFLPPVLFNAFFLELERMFPGLEKPRDGRFQFDGVSVIEHKWLPEGRSLEIDLDQAERILGYRPKF